MQIKSCIINTFKFKIELGITETEPLLYTQFCSGGPLQATLPEKAPSSLQAMCQEHRMWNQEGGSSVPALYERAMNTT